MQEISETKRYSRNLSEKRRRDTFNVIITELAAIVSNEGRKLDKSNVLRQTIAFLQKHNGRPAGCYFDGPKATIDGNGSFEWFLFLQKALDVFLLVISDAGYVLFVSENPFEILQKENIRGKSIGDLLDAASLATFQNTMERCLLSSDFDAVHCFDWCLHSSVANQPTKFVRIKVCGKFVRKSELNQYAQRGSAECAFCAVCAPRFSAVPLKQLPTSASQQFSCFYSLEWKILRVDRRWSKLTGWHAFEIVGRSGYELCHPDDLESVAQDHETLMYAKKLITKEHRLQTKSGSWLTVQSRCSLMDTGEYVWCVYWIHGDPVSVDESDFRFNGISAFSDEMKLPAQECDQTVHVFKPQPGVSIEHSPLPSLESSASPVTPDTQSMDTMKISPDEERLLCETLMQRQASLQQQIAQYQTELCLLKNRLYLSIGDAAPSQPPPPHPPMYSLNTPTVISCNLPPEVNPTVRWSEESRCFGNRGR